MNKWESGAEAEVWGIVEAEWTTGQTGHVSCPATERRVRCSDAGNRCLETQYG